MKKIKSIILSVAVLGCAQAFAAGPKPQYVQVDSAVVRVKASQFAASAGTLKLGDEVSIVESGKSWTKITSADGKISGWVPSSSLTSKKLIVKVQKTSANASEVAMAGKGLDKSFEKVYSNLSSVSFAEVDKIEANACSEKDAIAFINEGKLNMGGEQ